MSSEMRKMNSNTLGSYMLIIVQWIKAIKEHEGSPNLALDVCIDCNTMDWVLVSTETNYVYFVVNHRLHKINAVDCDGMDTMSVSEFYSMISRRSIDPLL